jgi:hypothetical protein
MIPTQGDAVNAPRTVDEFLALNPGERLKFGRSLGVGVTPEIVALLIRTYLTTPMQDKTREIYRAELYKLIGHVDPIALIVRAYRFVNTSTAPRELLAVHQEMTTTFASLHPNLAMSYIRQTVESGYKKVYFCGTLSRKLYPDNLDELLAAGMKTDDNVLYDRAATRWHSGQRVVTMTLVPDNNCLPESLGL